MNEAKRQNARLILQERNQLLSPGRGGHLRANDFALNLDGFSGNQHADGIYFGFVLIAQREMQDEIPVGDKPELLQSFAQRRKLPGADNARSFGGGARNLIHRPKKRRLGSKINDGFNFDEGALRECGNGEAGTGRIGGFEEFAHHAIDDSKVVD